MVKFLHLNRYARELISNDYEKSVWFEEGLRYDLKVLIAP